MNSATPTIEVWIEDANGSKLGSGPLVNVFDATQTDRLNAAGEFAFSIPALDPQAALVRSHRFARVWFCDAYAGWQQVAYGRIENITNGISADGMAVLNVSGGNELAALGDRICSNLSLTRYVRRHPAEVWQNENQASPPHDVAEWLQLVTDGAPGDVTTGETLIGYYGSTILVSDHRQFDRITFTVTDGQDTNNNNAYFTATYYDGETATWESVDISDGTAGYYIANRMSLHHTGDVVFTPPDTWTITPGTNCYQILLTIADPMEETDVSDVTVWSTEATPDPLGDVMAYAPDGWGLDAGNGYLTLQGRPLGPELLGNGGFDASMTGTADDATSDTWTSWTNVGTGAAAQILAMTANQAGTYAVKLNRTSDNAYIYQNVTVTAGMDYTLEFWTHGDATGSLRYRVLSGTDFSFDGTAEISGLQDTNVIATDWQRVRFTFTMPAGITSLTVAFYTPDTDGEAAWVDSVSLKAGGGETIYLQLRDESVLQALTRIAQASNENFILSPDARKVLWLGGDARDSELRAVAAASGVSAPNVLLLTNLSESEDASQLISRLYPYGGGMGSKRVTLAEATQPAPTGYTLNTMYNYLERDAAITALGVIEAVKSWSDIVPQTTTPLQRQNAANALLMQAWQYLETHSATNTERVGGDVPKFYSAAVVKGERMILSGYVMFVQYEGWRDSVREIDIARYVWITAVTRQIGGDGVHVASLELATVPRSAENDSLLIARNLIGLGKLAAHNTAEGY